MKKLLPFTVLLLFMANATFGQQLEPIAQPEPQTDYLKKSRRQNTIGAVLLGVGLTGLITTLIADGTQEVASDLTTFLSFGTIEPPPPKSYTAAYMLSAACAAASVPLFSAAYRNKKQGKATVSLKMHPKPPSLSVRNNAYPGLALRLDL